MCYIPIFGKAGGGGRTVFGQVAGSGRSRRWDRNSDEWRSDDGSRMSRRVDDPRCHGRSRARTSAPKSAFRCYVPLLPGTFHRRRKTGSKYFIDARRCGVGAVAGRRSAERVTQSNGEERRRASSRSGRGLFPRFPLAAWLTLVLPLCVAATSAGICHWPRCRDIPDDICLKEIN